MTGKTLLAVGSAFLLLTACQASDGTGQAGANVPDPDSTKPYDGISETEILRFSGTEPFWGGQVRGSALTYTTPENPDGTTITVERFAGRGGLSFSGVLDHADLEMTVTPMRCSDGMSDRVYPFAVMLKIGEETRNGCAWSDKHRFEGPERP
ncbi:hypothetical protein KK137_00265 [Croceibacterium sp. LX-88]|jgi:uncharacterized membrane protein|uniref:Lipoprotein n=1 Tax=Croceibacterium selenioxidans TaxID=2838833 RepID=A0ABS5VZ01_9SPHN|nr:hypothetical protein [Croceibacterium selenioxidans]MBT2132752.1 hypothetical protein [Croceibacterium selenioxidans]